MKTHTRHKQDVKWQALQDGYLGFFFILRDFDPKNFKNIVFIFEWMKMSIKSKILKIFKNRIIC